MDLKVLSVLELLHQAISGIAASIPAGMAATRSLAAAGKLLGELRLEPQVSPREPLSHSDPGDPHA